VERELEALEALDERTAGWAQHAGRYALIQGDHVDFFSTWDEAIRAGYRRFGLDPFLVTRVNGAEEARYVARMTITRQPSAAPGPCPI
jgi:hypothetical protein